MDAADPPSSLNGRLHRPQATQTVAGSHPQRLEQSSCKAERKRAGTPSTWATNSRNGSSMPEVRIVRKTSKKARQSTIATSHQNQSPALEQSPVPGRDDRVSELEDAVSQGQRGWRGRGRGSRVMVLLSGSTGGSATSCPRPPSRSTSDTTSSLLSRPD